MDQAKSGRFIADKRKEKGMTQKELARQLGIGDKAVSKWECGRGMPVAFTAALFFLIDMPVQMRNNWTYYFDLLTVAMDPILVLVMLLVTGNVKSFFSIVFVPTERECGKKPAFFLASGSKTRHCFFFARRGDLYGFRHDLHIGNNEPTGKRTGSHTAHHAVWHVICAVSTAG